MCRMVTLASLACSRTLIAHIDQDTNNKSNYKQYKVITINSYSQMTVAVEGWESPSLSRATSARELPEAHLTMMRPCIAGSGWLSNPLAGSTDARDQLHMIPVVPQLEENLCRHMQLSRLWFPKSDCSHQLRGSSSVQSSKSPKYSISHQLNYSSSSSATAGSCISFSATAGTIISLSATAGSSVSSSATAGSSVSSSATAGTTVSSSATAGTIISFTATAGSSISSYE